MVLAHRVASSLVVVDPLIMAIDAETLGLTDAVQTVNYVLSVRVLFFDLEQVIKVWRVDDLPVHEFC